METSTTAAFVIAVIALVLYYFKSKELTTRTLREKSLRQEFQSQEAFFKKEIEAIQHKQNELYRIKEEALKKELETIRTKLTDAYSTIPILANQQFDEFRKKEIDSLRTVLIESAKESALADLENWKIQYEAFYRQDAINRSQAVILGKVTEHLVPFQKNFPFNPKEARFIGSPIDIIVFDGIDNEDVVDIYILEIKTGNSSLNKRQRLIRDAVLNKRVHWRELNV